MPQIQEFIKELEKICFPLGKIELSTNCEFCAEHGIFRLRKGSEYLYRLFDILRNHANCNMKALQEQVYIQK